MLTSFSICTISDKSDVNIRLQKLIFSSGNICVHLYTFCVHGRFGVCQIIVKIKASEEGAVNPELQTEVGALQTTCWFPFNFAA